MKLRPLASHFWREWLRPLMLGAAIVLPLKSALADWEWVPTGSMEPTIVPVEFVWVNKLAYDLKVPFTTRHLSEWDNPHRGEVVVFISPADGIRLVKRVIGLPGDVIESRGDVLQIDGDPVRYGALAGIPVTTDARGYRQAVFAEEELPGRPHAVMILPQRPALRDFGPIRVPAGQYFLMGDNRDDSADSRFIGCVPRDQILGRATRIIVSFDLEHFGCPRPSRFLVPIR
jgi:signal peptidase I